MPACDFAKGSTGSLDMIEYLLPIADIHAEGLRWVGQTLGKGEEH
jgi:hypothetical protein